MRGGSRTRRNGLFLRKTRFAQVDMHIDQSRQYMTTRQIDCPVVRLKRDPTAYGNDFTVFDRQIARFEPSVPIELRTIENRLHFAVPFRTSPQRVHKKIGQLGQLP